MLSNKRFINKKYLNIILFKLKTIAETKINKHFAFTLIEAMLTMTILGIIAAIIVAMIKPNDLKRQSYNVLKNKTLVQLTESAQLASVTCAKGQKFSAIYDNCATKSSTHTFGTNEASLFQKYLKGTVGAVNTANGNCTARAGESSLALKNNVCLYFGDGYIFVDINGSQGPNTNDDQFGFYIDTSTPGRPVADGLSDELTANDVKCGVGKYWDYSDSSCDYCSNFAPITDCHACAWSAAAGHPSCTICDSGYMLVPSSRYSNVQTCKKDVDNCASGASEYISRCDVVTCNQCKSGYVKQGHTLASDTTCHYDTCITH